MDVGVVGVAGSDRPVVVVANHVGAVVDESDDPDDRRKLHVFAVEHDPQGEQQVLGVCGFAGFPWPRRVSKAPDEQLFEGGHEILTGGRQAVPDLSTPCFSVDGDQAVVLQIPKTLRQRLGCDRRHAIHQVGEPLGTTDEVPDQEQRLAA